MRGSRPHNPNAKFIIEDGIYFYQESDSGYYLGNVKIPGRKRRYPMRLHVYIWRKYNGDVPKGYHVHHKDENKDNNDISNLELKSAFAHLSDHGYEHSAASRQNMLEKAIPAAAKWHKSDKSAPFHKELYEKHTRDIWMQPVTKICDICGKEYTVNHASAYKSKYCSNKCKAAARRRSGVDNIEAICDTCGKAYIKNKYSKSTTCKDCNRVRIGLLNRKS
jgi:hypothetical protein